MTEGLLEPGKEIVCMGDNQGGTAEFIFVPEAVEMQPQGRFSL